MILYPLNDQIGSIELIEFMGSDLTIINDARVSYGKQKDNFDLKDLNLLDYLIKHEHYSPLRGVVFKFLVTAPLFVCRQWWRHSIASSYIDDQRGWNEQSLRYVEISENFYIPQMRKQSDKNKQSSEKEVVDAELLTEYKNTLKQTYSCYQNLLNKGISREVARTILPSSVYTQFRWTASLQTLLYFIHLRNSVDSQWEIQKYAKAIKTLITPHVPRTIEAYEKYATKN